MNCYIFDIDGTIADNSHRQHFVQQEKKDWKTYNSLMNLDTPHGHVFYLMHRLAAPYNESSDKIVLATGREEVFRGITHDWLWRYNSPHHGLYMRPEKDYRPDEIVKQEMLFRIRADGFNPIMAFDDRDKVVKMWRANGIPCAQVAEGNF